MRTSSRCHARLLAFATAIVSVPLLVACARGFLPVVGVAHGTDHCPSGLRPHVIPSLAVAECVDAAAADFDVCVASLGLNVPRPSHSGAVVIEMPLSKAAVSSAGNVSCRGNAQVFFESGGELDRARADALRACTLAFRRAAGLPTSSNLTSATSVSAVAKPPPPVAPSASSGPTLIY